MKQNGFTLAELMVVLIIYIILVSILVGAKFRMSEDIHNTPPTNKTVIEITHDGARCMVDGITIDCNTLKPSIDNKEPVYFPTGILVP